MQIIASEAGITGTELASLIIIIKEVQWFL